MARSVAAAAAAPSKSHGLPFEQTVTIINHSGKLISTGKQLVSIWKEAQNSYREKKAELKQERLTQRAQVPRAQTFDPARSVSRRQHHHSHYRHDEYDEDRRSRRAYDEQSVASSRRSHGPRRHKELDARSHSALTESNLKTLSEVSSTTPSKPRVSYRSPYAEPTPAGALSKAEVSRSIAPTEWKQPAVVIRRRSEPEVPAQHKNGGGGGGGDEEDKDDVHLAYGDMPPDLAARTDLDPKAEEEKAEELVHKIEDLLDEAHCAQHSATVIIKQLQERPDAAAAVALGLAELSTFVAKLSPAFITFLKGCSPAVFSLLASPQFLIGTGIAVGVTVVMFGGWKIIQKVAENQIAKIPMQQPVAAALQGQPEYPNGVDEALVVEKVEEELSTIETWRRGIMPSWEEESADVELITPRADRVRRERRTSRDPKDPLDDFDSSSRRGPRTHKTSKAHPSSHRTRHERDSPEKDRKSSRGDAASVAPSSVSKKSSSKKKDLKAIDDGRSLKSEELSFRSRPRVQQNMLKALFRKKEPSEAVYA